MSIKYFRLAALAIVVSLVLSACSLVWPPQPRSCMTVTNLAEFSELSCYGELVTIVADKPINFSADGKSFLEFRVVSTSSDQAVIQLADGSLKTISLFDAISAGSKVVAHVVSITGRAVVLIVVVDPSFGYTNYAPGGEYVENDMTVSSQILQLQRGIIKELYLDQCFGAATKSGRTAQNMLMHVDDGYVNFRDTIGPTRVGQPIFIKTVSGSEEFEPVAVLLRAYTDPSNMRGTKAVVFWPYLSDKVADCANG